MRHGLVTYEGLPRGAHVLRGDDLPNIWRSVERFVVTCTTPVRPPEADYQFAVGEGVSHGSSLRIVARLTAAHGLPREWQSVVGAETIYRWRVRRPTISREIDQLQEDLRHFAPIPRSRQAELDSLTSVAPPALAVTYNLRFIFPHDGTLLPYQDSHDYGDQCFDARSELRLGQSLLYLRLTTKATLYAFFSLPFEQSGGPLDEYREFLRVHFPTRMSAAGWRQWRLNRAGTGYYSRVLR